MVLEMSPFCLLGLIGLRHILVPRRRLDLNACDRNPVLSKKPCGLIRILPRGSEIAVEVPRQHRLQRRHASRENDMQVFPPRFAGKLAQRFSPSSVTFGDSQMYLQVSFECHSLSTSY